MGLPVVGGGAERLAGGEHELAVEGVALVGAVEHDVPHRATLLGGDQGHPAEATGPSLPGR
jgi:hypothetical protein